MNLKDRMNSDLQESKQTEIVSNTTPLSNQPSRETQLLDQALTQIASQKEQIQQLSSENSTLKNELLLKSETIVSLNGQIEKLNESDLILEQNRTLLEKNRVLQQSATKAKQEAEQAISDFKQKNNALELEISTRLNHAKQLEKETASLNSDMRSLISTKAEKLATETVMDEIESLRDYFFRAQESFKSKTHTIYGIAIFSLVYSLFVTILTAAKSKRMVSDFISFFSVLGQFIALPIMLEIEVVKAVWSIRAYFPIMVLGELVAFLLMTVSLSLIIWLYYKFSSLLIKACKVYYEHFGDIITGIVSLVSMAFEVWFADYLTMISWNLIVIWIIIHIIYLLFRMRVKTYGPKWY